MFSRDTWKEIFETIQKNKLRAFLSGFTLAIGIFIFIVLLGFGNGLKNTFNKFFADDATNIFFIFTGKTSIPYAGYKANRKIEFDNSDLKDIEKNFAMFVDYLTPIIFGGGMVKYKNESNRYGTRAVAPSYRHKEMTIMMKGRYLNNRDIEDKTKYAVIGRLVEEDLFDKENSIGKFIDIGGSSFKVIGVFQDNEGDNKERQIYIPYTTEQLRRGNTDKIDRIILGFKPEIGYLGAIALEKSLEKYLKNKKFINPNDRNGIFINNMADDLKKTQQLAKVLQIIVSLVALGTIMAGIIGIGNIMVFVVKERTKELGIRKALGATPKSVISTILLESIFITTISGFFGMSMGVVLLSSMGKKLEDYFIIDPYIDMGIAIFATIFLIVSGAIAGYVPARRAAGIKPILALRDE